MKTLLRSKLVLGTALVASLTGIVFACSNFLDTPAQGTLDENALSTREGVEGSLIAAYRSLDCNNSTNGNWGCAASNWAFATITSEESYKGSTFDDQYQAQQIELYAWNNDQAQDYLQDKWASMYEGINRANATIRLLQKVSATPGEISHADSVGILGEAIFLRAHFHFELWRMWGNVPYYYETDADYRKPNDADAQAGADSVAQKILADLNTAINLLPATPRFGDKGRASAWTARAYKGRLLTYMHQYAAAVAVFDSVIASGPYALQPSFDQVWTGFNQYSDGPETILAYQASVNDGEPDGNNANYGERLNLPYAGSPFKCCGFNQPSQNLANAFRVDPVRGLPTMFIDSTTWNNRDSTYVASQGDTLDPRMDWTIGRDSVPYKDWGLHDTTWVRLISNGGRYSAKKNAQEKASGAVSKVGWQPEQENAVHIHIFRYADLLLMDAEAKIETNDLAGALTLVNEVRARAGVKAQGCGGAIPSTPVTRADTTLVNKYPLCAGDGRMAVAIDDSTITWATYKVGQYLITDWPTQDRAREAVRIERRLELAMEGQRFFDLRRYGDAYAQKRMADYLLKEKIRRPYKTAQLPYVPGLNTYYPIPTAEIDLSIVGGVQRLTQNPGW